MLKKIARKLGVDKAIFYTSAAKIVGAIVVLILMYVHIIAIKAKGVINMPGVETYSIREFAELIYAYFGQTMDQGIFGKAVREDVGMQDLKLDGALPNSLLPDIQYTSLKETLKFYE